MARGVVAAVGIGNLMSLDKHDGTFRGMVDP